MKKPTPCQTDCEHCGARQGSVPGRPIHHSCNRCKATFYCSRACQVAHWKASPSHKDVCVTPQQRTLAEAAVDLAETPAGRTCAICCESLLSSRAETLPCNHSYHEACLERMRLYSMYTCPTCGSPFPTTKPSSPKPPSPTTKPFSPKPKPSSPKKLRSRKHLKGKKKQMQQLQRILHLFNHHALVIVDETTGLHVENKNANPAHWKLVCDMAGCSRAEFVQRINSVLHAASTVVLTARRWRWWRLFALGLIARIGLS